MKKRSIPLNIVGFIIYTLAAFLGMCLIMVSVVPDVESVFYGFKSYGGKPLRSLSCPVMMTVSDHQSVTIRLHNPYNKTITRLVKAQFSSPFTFVSIDEKVELRPGETKKIGWEVSQENIDLKYFIFGFVRVYPTSSLPLVESTCGTLILKLPFNGGPVIYYVVLALTVLGLGFGIFLWQRHSDRSQPGIALQSGFMYFLAVVIMIGVVSSIMGLWMVGILALVITLLAWSISLYPRKTTI